MDFVRFTWSLEKTHLTLIQRCALTVQLQPSIAHIPGGALSTLPTRNTKQHRDTDHTTIARSRFSPFGRTLLPPPMLSAIHPRSSSGEQKAALFHPDRSPSIPPPRGDLSSHLSFTAHRYAPLSSGSRSSFDRSFLFLLQPLTFVPKFQYPRRIRRSIFVYIRSKGRTLAILFPRDPRFSSAKTSHGPAFQRHARPDGTDGRGDEKMWDGKLVEWMYPPRDI